MRILLWSILMINVTTVSAQYEYEYKPELTDIDTTKYVEFINGKGYLISRLDFSTVGIHLQRTGKWEVVVDLAIQYNGERLNFIPSESLTITGLDRNYERVIYETYSHKDYLDEIAKKQNSRMFWTSLGEAMSNYNAGQTTTTTQTNATVRDNYGNVVSGSATSYQSTYDPNKAKSSQEISRMRLQRMQEQQLENLTSIEESIMKPVTLYYGDFHYGYVFLKIPKVDRDAHAIQFDLKIGKDLHTVLFTSTDY
ncbi:MAG: hypothetical protein ABJG47_14675 [Ekhidna sp.]